jgi:hypothetical protein
MFCNCKTTADKVSLPTRGLAPPRCVLSEYGPPPRVWLATAAGGGVYAPLDHLYRRVPSGLSSMRVKPARSNALKAVRIVTGVVITGTTHEGNGAKAIIDDLRQSDYSASERALSAPPKKRPRRLSRG